MNYTTPIGLRVPSTPARALTRALARALAASLALTLGACGSNSADDVQAKPSPLPPPLPLPSGRTSSLTEGRWVSTNLTPTYSAIVLPAFTDTATPAIDTVWALAQDASTLIKVRANGVAQTAGAVTGNVYTLGTSRVSAVTGGSYTWAASSSSNASAPQMSLQPVLGTTALFERTDVMSTPLRADQANGRWSAPLGANVVNWVVQSANTTSTSGTPTTNLNGTSTTGCTYSGQSTVVATQSVYRVKFTETCSSTTPPTQTFTGVATMAPGDARMTVLVTNDAESRAAALLFVRQP